MYVVVDRLEGNFAICENRNKELIHIEITQIPSGTKEGDILLIKDNCISIDKKETEKRKLDIEKLMDDLWE